MSGSVTNLLQRNTYISRILELEQIFPSYDDEEKELPARPESELYDDSTIPLPSDHGDDEDEEDEEVDEGVIGMATVTRIVNHDSYVPEPQQPHYKHEIQASQIPQRRQSLMPPFEQQQQQQKPTGHLVDQYAQRSMSRSPAPAHLSPPMSRQSMMISPLSPRRPLSPAPPPPANLSHPPVAHPEAVAENQAHILPSQNRSGSLNSNDTGHRRQVSQESMSWLDTIDESGGSTGSSVHSRTSSFHVRRKHIRAASGATEAEFDAALDAAVEAAYDDGFEPVNESDHDQRRDTEPESDHEEDDEELMSLRRKVEIARERVRETEREAAILQARDRAREVMSRQSERQMDGAHDMLGDDSEAEEERMLEEMTRGYVMDDFDFGMQSKSALPRESDSSGYTERTWHTSLDSKTTGDRTTMMSTIGEEQPSFISKLPDIPDAPPPSAPLPAPPTSAAQQFSRPLQLGPSDGQEAKETLRSKRLSGQGQVFKQLKIETASSASSISEAPNTASPALSRPASRGSRPGTSSGMPPIPTSASSAKDMPPPPIPGKAALQQARSRQGSDSIPPNELTTPPTPSQNFNLQNGDELPRSGSPGRAPSRGGIRKNFSSSSLKNLKVRNLSVSNIDEDTGPSPNTPSQTQFATAPKMPAMPTLPTPITTAFANKMHMPSGGLYLFDNDIHYPNEESSSSMLMFETPVPLEPCPTEYLLRPFWLMRQLYQTLVHPRGGYLSTKLFVPREVWQVRNVKIKGLEEKIGACDYLTASLQKLGRVDTNDADAVLEEMQGFEDSLEVARQMLSKKLGNEVGVQGSGILFKDAAPGTEAEMAGAQPKSSSMPGSKSSSFSWRRLRSKSSGLALNSYGGGSKQQLHQPNIEGKEQLSMSTLPMTTMSNIRFTKRNVSNARFEGPNANYMGALARLFDAAQILGKIPITYPLPLEFKLTQHRPDCLSSRRPGPQARR